VVHYRLGEFPRDKPEWLIHQLSQTVLYETQNVEDLEVWLLDSTESFSVPAAYLLEMPPGYTLFRHGHPCHRFEVIVQGSLDFGDGTVGQVGDVMTSKPRQLYGPHTAGPEGCTTVEIFSSLDGMFRLLVEDDDGRVREIETRSGELPPNFLPYKDGQRSGTDTAARTPRGVKSEKESAAKHYALGDYPKDKPQWLVDQLGATPLYQTRDVNEDLKVWLLDSTESFSVPAAYLLEMPPGYELFRHGHPCHRFEVIVQGSLDFGDGTIGQVGDVMTSKPRQLYGPHTAGPEGCTTIEVFSSLDAMWDLLIEDADQGTRLIDSRAGERPPNYVPFRANER
jgi:anti-sigma factor ChrR (cupin superfamily)